MLHSAVPRPTVLSPGLSPTPSTNMAAPQGAAALRHILQRAPRPLPRSISAAAAPQAPAIPASAQELPPDAVMSGVVELIDEEGNNQTFMLRLPSSFVQQNNSFHPRQCYLSARLEFSAPSPESEGFPVAHAHALELSDTPPQARSMPSMPSMQNYSQGAGGPWETMSLEAKWQHVFANPSDFFDARAVKQGRQPDFKSRSNGRAALWLDTRGTPPWVYDQVKQVFGEVPQDSPLPGTMMNRQQKMEALLASPQDFIDIRAEKRNPRAPDFKHKSDQAVAIWLSDADPSTQASVEQMFGPPPPAAQPMGAQSPYGQGYNQYDSMYAPPQQQQPTSPYANQGYGQVQSPYANPQPTAPQYAAQPSMPDAATAAPQVFEQPGYAAGFGTGQPHKGLQGAQCYTRRGSTLYKHCKDDNKWEQYFANPQGYFDNRATKNNPRAPDFKSRGDGEALWLNSAPDWAKERLGA